MKSWRFLKFWKTDTWKELSSKFYDSETHWPRTRYIFRALELTPFDSVKCVILGQDPYPTKGYANGLAFSVYPHVRPIPRSLANIFKEYQDDLGLDKPKTGDLTPWAQNGVLLLNSIFTVEEGKPLSHAGLGWEKLSFEIVRALGSKTEGDRPVFCLWGRTAQDYKGALRGTSVVCSSHPSPLSAAKGETPFFGSRPFSRVNEYLIKQGTKPINWKLP